MAVELTTEELIKLLIDRIYMVRAAVRASDFRTASIALKATDPIIETIKQHVWNKIPS